MTCTASTFHPFQLWQKLWMLHLLVRLGSELGQHLRHRRGWERFGLVANLLPGEELESQWNMSTKVSEKYDICSRTNNLGYPGSDFKRHIWWHVHEHLFWHRDLLWILLNLVKSRSKPRELTAPPYASPNTLSPALKSAVPGRMLGTVPYHKGKG